MPWKIRIALRLAELVDVERSAFQWGAAPGVVLAITTAVVGGINGQPPSANPPVATPVVNTVVSSTLAPLGAFVILLALLDGIRIALRKSPLVRERLSRLILARLTQADRNNFFRTVLPSCGRLGGASEGVRSEASVLRFDGRPLPRFVVEMLVEAAAQGRVALATRLALAAGQVREAVPDEQGVLLRYSDIPTRFHAGRGEAPEWAYGAEQVEAICERYALAWQGNGPMPQPNFHRLHDLGLRATADQTVLELERKVAAAALSMPHFHRLNYVRQLGTANLVVNLEASHNRLAHLLGALNTAALFLVELRASTNDELYRGTLRSNEVIKAFLIVACAHDLFHGPMGHTIESLRGILLGRKAHGTKIDKIMLGYAVDDLVGDRGWTANPLRILVQAVVEPENVRQTGEIIRALYQPSYIPAVTKSMNLSEPVFRALAELLDGTIDVDRSDYLPRDHLHLGWDWQPLRDAVATLAREARVVPDGLAFRDCDQARTAIDTLREARNKAYAQVYEAKTKLALDSILQHSIYYFLSSEGYEENDAKDAQGYPGAPSAFRRPWPILSLTDDELYHLAYELSGKARHAASWSLLRQTVFSQPPAVVECGRSKTGDFAILAKAYQAISEDLTKKWTTGDKIDMVKAAAAVAKATGLSESLVWTWFLAREVSLDDLATRLEYERALWKHLQNNPDLRAWLTARGLTHELERPLIFIYPSWEFRQTGTRRAERVLLVTDTGEVNAHDLQSSIGADQEIAAVYCLIPSELREPLSGVVQAFATSATWHQLVGAQ